MSVYVDNVRIPATIGRIRARWSHMTADTDEELHAMAIHIGLRREWFQPNERRPAANHYDVTDSMRARAIRAGAIPERWEDGATRRRRAATPIEPPTEGIPNPRR